jgi:Ni/Co efflux regulator RcnB
MSKIVWNWLGSSLFCGSIAIGTPGLVLAAKPHHYPVLRVQAQLPADGDIDEGIPGGTIRLSAPNENDPPPPAPTRQEKSAAAAQVPTAEPAEASPVPAELAPTEPRAPLSNEMAALRDKVRKAMAIYYPRHLNTREHSPWEMMHGIIAYGVDTQLFRGNSKGEEINAIAWMCYNGSCRGEQLFYLNNDHIVARKGPGLQGHYGQFLAIIAQCHVKGDYPMSIGGKSFTIQDLVDHEKVDCQAGEELTFKLIGLMHYLDSDATWMNREGQLWSMQRLVKEELAQPIRGAACGGTHRLMGLSYAVNKRIQRGQPVTGEFRRAQIFINDYHRYTFSLQNPDGSFSTDWFKGPGAMTDVDRRLKTTGHIAEWLSFSMKDEDLQHPRMVKAIDYLATILVSGKDRNWEIGPLGHGLHALRIYDRRMFKQYDAPTPPAPIATQPKPADANKTTDAPARDLPTAAAPSTGVQF